MNRIELRLKTYPDSILRKRAKKVDVVDDRIRQILKEMARIMYEHKGVGLAANQVGLDYCLLVADAGDGLYKLINPRIILKRGKDIMEEGCLSIPGICIKVKRANKIKIEALDENNRLITIEAEGLLSRIFQHEIDHLNGKLIIDYASILKRMQIKKRLKELKERIDEGVYK